MNYILIGYVVWLIVANIATAALYVYDKRAAQSHAAGSGRVPERKLLLWSLLGGWPAALIVGQKIRHKTHKLSFRIPFCAAVVTNIILHAVAVWFLYFR
ncbi:MAG: hypothetical protein Aurels2KO_15540 [Aureliella sp.]